MSGRSRAAIAIWRRRTPRTTGDRAYVVYAILMAGLVVVIPVARAVWLSATSAAGVAVFASPAAPGATMLVVVTLWAGALLLGRDRGPALRPPFLTHALVTSDQPRSAVFRDPLLRAGALVTAVTTTAAGVVGGSVASAGLVDPLGVAVFIAVGVLVGVITTVVWLAGQALPSAAVPIALGILALGGTTAVAPALRSVTPWGWVGLAYPGGGALQVLAALAALAVVLAAAAPILLNRLGLAQTAAQAARWESATIHAAGMDFAGAATVYQGRPHLGRRIPAVRPSARLPAMFLIRGVVAAARTPGRLVTGLLALVAAGVLLTLAFAPAAPGWLLGAAAGLLAFAGLGPLTDGIRHAASVVADLPLYGISDEQLLAGHALAPLVVVVIVMLATALGCSIVVGIGFAAPILGVLALALLALVARVGSALKGALPIALLTPIPTPMGDLGAIVRMAWALDAVLLAAAAGAAAALAVEQPVLLVGVTALLVGIGIGRWRRRA